MHVIKRLFKPLVYLRIEHPEKIIWDYGIPFGSAFLITCGLWALPKGVNVFGDGGLVGEINSLLQMLIGFYIAALAALASFDRPGLDNRFEGRDILVPEGGKLQIITRRQFLCLLFGYLSLLSVILFLIGLGSVLVAKGMGGEIPLGEWIDWKSIFLFAYLTLFFNLITTTFVGLYYLSYRIHQFTKE